MTFLLMLSFLFSIVIVAQPMPNNVLYIYHNGKDTLIKNYEYYKLLNPQLEKAGHPIGDQKWAPDVNSSAFYYYQVVNQEFLYITWSTFIDSTVIKNFESGNPISENKIDLIPVSGDTIYNSYDEIQNRTGVVIYRYYFTNDSLRVTRKIVTNFDVPEFLVNAFKYGTYTAK